MTNAEAVMLVEDLCAVILETADPESEVAQKAHRVLHATPALRRAHFDKRSLDDIRTAHEALRRLGAHLNLQAMQAKEG